MFFLISFASFSSSVLDIDAPAPRWKATPKIHNFLAVLLGRREFLKMAGAHAGALLAGGACASAGGGPGRVGRAPDVAIIGAGAFGGWTAWHLRSMGAHVTLVDTWGPGNSRATSGDETRGV